MRSPLLLILLNAFYFIAGAQVDSLVQPTDPDQQVIEDFLQNTESEGTFDFNTIFEELEFYRENPINLNTITEGQLQDLNLLSDIQILEILKYRQTAGDFISIYELQAVPSLDLQTVRRLLPFVRVSGDLDDYQTPIGQMMREGRNELYLRWFRILEDQRGYTPLGQDETGSRYLGDPNQFYMRYKHA